MAKQIFVNMGVKDLNKSIAFFTKLSFTFNPQFTDEKATCMIISENIFAMLLTEAYFKTFTKKELCDAKKNTEMIIALDADSREAVEDIVKKATDAGGTIYAEPQEYEWMYQHGFEDLDGHQWEVIYMDMSKFPQQ